MFSSIQYTIATTLIALVITTLAFAMFFSKKWDPRGQHCLVTGGSSGLGLALAITLAKRGAHVSIVARDQERLDKALKRLEAARQSSTQVVRAYSFSVNSETGSAEAIKAAAAAHNDRCPDAFFLCAGAARPGFFLEQTEQSIRSGMEMSYYAQAFTALAAAKEMVRTGVKGKIVFTSSVLAFFSIVGYSAYSPTKFAIRGLAESLQSEFILYGIQVHIAFPATILTPGFKQENKTKPKITLKIEEADEGSQPEPLAVAVLNGVQKGTFHITYGFNGDVFRASSAGSSQRNSYFVDMVYSLIAYVALPIWRRIVDRDVRAHRKEHAEYLRAKGLV